MKNNERNGYTFMKQWFDFANNNSDRVAPVHAALYFWLIQLNNTLDWKEKFGVPTVHTMEMLGIRNYRTFKKAFDDLIEWNFIQLHNKSRNQYTANVIALVKFTKALPEQIPKHCRSTADIVKPIETIETIETFETPKEEGLTFKILNLFIEVKGGYVVTDPEGERRAASSFLKIFESESPGLGPDDTLEAMRQFFEKCVNISDNWLRPQMSLPIIVKYFNRIKSTIEQPNTGGVTDAELAELMASKYGIDSPQRAGARPDLGKVDSNYLNDK